MTKIADGTKVFLKAEKPLPNGGTVKLRGAVWYTNDAGKLVVRIHTPGMYDGGVYTLNADEVEIRS